MTDASKNNIFTRIHTGVYGIHLSKDKSRVLLILKSRGPYKGMYDLPGGKIEKNETKVQALNREYQEEVGSSILSHTFLYKDQLTFPYISQSQGEVLFQHTGYFYKIILSDKAQIKTTPDGHDSLGALYVDIVDILKEKIIVTPMARRAIIAVIN